MIFPLSHILLTFPLLIAFIFFFYITGSLFSFLIQPQANKTAFFSFSFYSIFSRLFTGIVLVSSLYAIAVTKFQTCMLPAPVLLAFFWRINKTYLQDETVVNSHGKRPVLLCLATALLCWIYFSFFFFSFDTDRVSYIENDTAYYARLSSYLNFSGAENTSMDYLHLSKNIPEPYHYGDLWLTAFVNRITGLHHTLIIFSIVYPLLASVIMTGLALCVYNFFRQPVLNHAYLVLLAALFVHGFSFLMILKGDAIVDSLIMHPKLFIVVSIIIMIMETLSRQAWNQMMAASCLGVVLFGSITPVLVTSVFFILLIGLLTKQIRLTQLIRGFLLILITGIYLFIFYYPYFFKQTESFSFPSAEYNFKTTLNIIIGGVTQLTLVLPFIILFYFIIKKERLSYRKLLSIFFSRFDVLFLLFLPLIGLLYWAFFYFKSPEYVQFFQNVLLPVATISMVLIVMKGVIVKNKIIKISSWMLLALSIIGIKSVSLGIGNSVSKSDLLTTKHFLAKYPSSYFVNLQGETELQAVFKKNTVLSQPLLFLDYLTVPYVNISLNAPYLIYDSSLYSAAEKNLSASAPFSIFVNRQDKKISAEQNMYNFIKEKNIRFLTVSPQVQLPLNLKNLIKDSIRISENGWKIYYIGT